MYAVIESGGKQYRVSPGDLVELEKLEAQPGAEVVFEQVLMLGGDQVVVGTPMVAGARVIAEVVEQCKADKVVIFKYKRRKNYIRHRGHRQLLTAVKIKEIKAG
jgi:large subunit ribosomal protein L21